MFSLSQKSGSSAGVDYRKQSDCGGVCAVQRVEARPAFDCGERSDCDGVCAVETSVSSTGVDCREQSECDDVLAVYCKEWELDRP